MMARANERRVPTSTRAARALAVGMAALVAALGVVATDAGAARAGGADTPASLPSVSSGARPGPDVLYAPQPAAPQLENRSPRFRADPLLVMGAEAYVDGEYLYQDWLYDDTGSDTGANDAGGQATAGDVDYPTDRARYGGNAADLVEVRIAPGDTDVAYRFTLNTLLVVDSTIVTLAYDTDRDSSTGRSILPRDPGFAIRGTDEVITLWGTGAEHSHLTATGAPITTAVAVTTDLEANQLTVVVPRTVSDPTGTWRATVAAGLFDPASGGWLRPAVSATAHQPGGAGPLDPIPAGVFNLGFRLDERPAGLNPPELNQSTVIRSKAAGRYQRDIDFDALARREGRSTVPATGTISRIFASRIAFGEGKDYAASPELLGQLQPYSLSIPSAYVSGEPAGLTLALHSHQQHHWQYNHQVGTQQIGEQRQNIVVACECRGEDGWYQHEAEYDVFEVWNDVASHYSLDPDRVAVYGYSMGGYGVYRLATLYPDLFGRAFTIAGPPAEGRWLPPLPMGAGVETLTNLWLENARNVPFLNVAAAADELVPVAGTRAQNLGAPEAGVRGFEQLGYRFRYVLYPAADHFTFPFTSYNLPYAVEFLGDARVDRDPNHVTFSYVPASDDPALGLVHDHAYWVSEVELADSTAGSPLPKATVDAVTHVKGLGDPPSSGAISPGAHPLPFVDFGRTWGDASAVAAENKLTLTLDNVGAVVLDADRAGLDLTRGITLEVTSSAPAKVTLRGRGRDAPVEVPAGTSTVIVSPAPTVT